MSSISVNAIFVHTVNLQGVVNREKKPGHNKYLRLVIISLQSTLNIDGMYTDRYSDIYKYIDKQNIVSNIYKYVHIYTSIYLYQIIGPSQ